jgi:hypothetical protein
VDLASWCSPDPIAHPGSPSFDPALQRLIEIGHMAEKRTGPARSVWTQKQRRCRRPHRHASTRVVSVAVTVYPPKPTADQSDAMNSSAPPGVHSMRRLQSGDYGTRMRGHMAVRSSTGGAVTTSQTYNAQASGQKYDADCLLAPSLRCRSWIDRGWQCQPS